MTLFKEKYPKGYTDYVGDLMSIDKPDGTSFTAVQLQTDDTTYLIKIPVRIDGYEEAEKDLFEGGNGEDEEGGGDDVFPDEGTESSFASEPESEDE